jgi:hypothetical protein
MKGRHPRKGHRPNRSMVTRNPCRPNLLILGLQRQREVVALPMKGRGHAYAVVTPFVITVAFLLGLGCVIWLLLRG